MNSSKIKMALNCPTLSWTNEELYGRKTPFSLLTNKMKAGEGFKFYKCFSGGGQIGLATVIELYYQMYPVFQGYRVLLRENLFDCHYKQVVQLHRIEWYYIETINRELINWYAHIIYYIN